MKQLLLFVILFVVSWSAAPKAQEESHKLSTLHGTYRQTSSMRTPAMVTNALRRRTLTQTSPKHGIHETYFTFEPPVYVNDNRTGAVGRVIRSFLTTVPTAVIDAGADGHSVVQCSHALMSYAMTWDTLHQDFVVRLIDQDDTSVYSLRYNSGGIGGDSLEVPEFETRAQGASLGIGNSHVATVTLKKTDSHPFDKIPTYDEHWATLKATEVGSSEPDLEDSPANGVGITILVLFGCGFICLAIYYTACRRKPSGGQESVALPEKSLYKRVQTRVIF